MAHDNSNPYRLLVTLNGQHTDTITCMQFSPCGEYLVTGADDLRMNVFDCADNFKNILSISSTSPASAICWDPEKPRSCFVGYSSGAVVSHTFGKDQEEWAAEILLFNGRCRVVALAWDSMLAVATERNVFLINDIKASTDGQRGTVDIQRGAITISPPATNHGQPEPRSICFTPDGSLVIAYLEHGVVYVLVARRKDFKWTFIPRALRIGRFFYSQKLDLFVVHNLYDGFDAYMMKSRAHFRSYRFPASEKDNVPLSCIVINDGRHIVCGTTSGKAVVLDAITLAHQADLLHCHPGLVQDVAHCSKNGVNILATSASEKGPETTIKIWTADVVSCQSTGYADRITEAFRGIIDLLGDLCARVIRWRSRTIEIPVLSLIFWTLVLLTVVTVFSYFNASTLEEFRLSLTSACRSFWAILKDIFLKNGQVLQKAIIFSVRACYLFLKGVVIALYTFLEEEQVSVTSTESRVTPGDSLKLVDILKKQDTETARGSSLVIDVSNTRDDESLDTVAVPAQVGIALDWAVSVGFLRFEAGIPPMEDVFDRGVTTDIQVYTAGPTSSTLGVQTSDQVKN
ncbi:WD40-repeat-containing domain protein [Thelephora terrestris]|uniref:WD40-repeat-containing domain protein n=1 Tax=Thelephora terrestris TaxID=56493 RepID=A0A9P6HMK7_9AGAM|nr:WD40-repeat-containing domain protein [Thelephora terrestris]